MTAKTRLPDFFVKNYCEVKMRYDFDMLESVEMWVFPSMISREIVNTAGERMTRICAEKWLGALHAPAAATGWSPPGILCSVSA